MSARILIIEDDRLLGELLVKKLQSAGYEVELTLDGKEGLDRMPEFLPDLVLLDIVLPSMDGYQVLEAKVADSRIADIPVVIVSNSGQPVEISRAVKLGAKDYIVKAQVDPNEVLDKVREHLLDSNASMSLAGKKILTIEDDKFLSEIMVLKLKKHDCIVEHSSTGEDGLEKLTSFKPDLVLLDLILPGISGFDVLTKMRATNESKDIPVIVLSNLSQKEDIDRARGLGAEQFIVKAMTTPTQIYSEIVAVMINRHMLDTRPHPAV